MKTEMTKDEKKIGTVRYQYALMAMLVTTGNYVCRQNINIAIVDMTLPQVKNGVSVEPFCQIQQNLTSIESGVEQTWKVEPEVFKFSQKVEITEDRFHWSPEEIGTLLGSFYWGYCATMLIGAVAAQRYGTYRVISYVMLTNAVITFLFPILVSTPGAGLKMGIIARVLLGASSGPLMPALQGSWYWWATPDEITTVIAIQTTGIVLGNCIGQGVMGVVSSSMGWQAAFYLPGAVMFGVTLLWVMMVHDKPERGESNEKVTCFVRRKFAISHRITSDEVCYIVDKRSSKAKTARLSDVPWRKIMVCLPLYAKGLMWFAMSYTIYTVTTISPLYLKRVHGLNSAQCGYIFGAVAIITAAVNMAIAVMADNSKSLVTSTQMRKAICGSLSVIVVMCFIFIMKLDCDTHTIIFCIAILVMFSSSVSTIGLKPVTAEMAGRFSSIVFGIVNMMGNGAGFLVPQVMGKILNDKDQGNPESWLYVFGIPLALYTVCMIVFLIFGSSELQNWADTEKNKKPDLFLNIEDSCQRQDFIYTTPKLNGHSNV